MQFLPRPFSNLGYSVRKGWIIPLLCLAAASPALAVPPPELPDPAQPRIAPASEEGERQLAGFKIPEGMRGSLFAAEPDVANPVAFHVDDRGRVFVCESFRQNQGVTDNRGHDQRWLDRDLAARTVEDRRRYHEELLPERGKAYYQHDDRIRLLQDTNGDGRADDVRVFASGFNDLVDGTGAGVLALGDDVYYTCIPYLWRLRDTTGDLRADARQPLHYGYGVRVAFRGHDMHGLIVGPDGMLYYSLGDRGYHVEFEGNTFSDPASGAVFRCHPDGSGLEVVATGLRNPQELAFDEYGNLFTGDNNSDSGDRARWVYVAEGGDTGWRMYYQYLNDRGPFNREKLWHPRHEGQPAYIVPPIANFADGPSGLAYYPGTGLSEDFRGRFLLCDFRGGPANSGIRSLRVKPKGAFFELVDAEQPFWNMLATDVQFGPDGAVWVSDWVNGWNGEGKGRLYRFEDPAAAKSAAAVEAQTRLREGGAGRPAGELASWLAHADQRVRQLAQFELVNQARGGSREARDLLARTLRDGEHQLARIHAIWGLQQLGEVELSALADADAEIRAQAAGAAGRVKERAAAAALVKLLRDESPRVQYFASQALGKLGHREALPEVLELLVRNDDQDPILRHGGIMALAGIAAPAELAALRAHASPSVRVAAVVALRKLGRGEVAEFLGDGEGRVVEEAARAIYDLPLPEAYPRLAALIDRGVGSDPLLRRVLNANHRLGGEERAVALANFAASENGPVDRRREALELLADWNEPRPRDRVLGDWRPMEPRPRTAAETALRRALPRLLTSRDEVRGEALKVAAGLGISDVVPALREQVSGDAHPAAQRADALRALAGVDAGAARELLAAALASEQPLLRAAGREVTWRQEPSRGVELLAAALEEGAVVERQQAAALLGVAEGAEAERALARGMELLLAEELPAGARLDILTAARRKWNREPVKGLLEKYEAGLSAEDHLARYREALAGGDPERGRRVFYEKTEVSCVRCHKIGGEGGEVGPDLSGLGAKKPIEYLLEAIVDPNRVVAENFESVTVFDQQGRVHSGVLRAQDEREIRLITPEGNLKVIPRAEVEELLPGKSAMPEDLVQKLTPFELRDLVAFLAEQKQAEREEGK